MVGAHSSFSNLASTFRAFLYAPRKDKVRRLLSRGKNEKEAEDLVNTIDHERADFIEQYFNAEWPDRAIYHAMLNTAIGKEMVVQMLLSFIKAYDTGATTPQKFLFHTDAVDFASSAFIPASLLISLCSEGLTFNRLSPIRTGIGSSSKMLPRFWR